MPDPLEVLRTPLIPVSPDPGFAARLRARVEQAIVQPKGATVQNLTLESESPVRTVSAGVIPYLIVGDARRALDWYVDALGARRRGEAIVMPDGRIGHAELELGGAPVFLADESSESHVAAPGPDARATVSLTAEVPNVDALTERSVSAGATLERPPADYPYGRNAVIRDPFGHRWILSSASSSEPAPREDQMRQGDIGYASLWVPDVTRAASFFGSVLGWSYGPGSGEQGRQVEGVTPHHGMWGRQPRSELFLCYEVDDVDATVERVRAAGGEAEEPTEEPYGRLANCVDDQGTPFAVFHPPAGSPAPRGPANGSRHGDLSYVTLEVIDSAKARAFYSIVLGWRFSPGRVEDGWNIEEAVPMMGMQGGHPVATAVPMYRVEDIGVAVDRVRSAGGIATEPTAQPYGITSECEDDQGTRFYLGELGP